MTATATRAGTPSRRPRPTGMTVLYDADCSVCRRARRWVERQRQLVPVRFVAAGSARAASRFPGLDVGRTLDEVTVVTDEGAVIRGDDAWIAVLWAVARTRGHAIRLAHGRGRRWLSTATTAADAIRRRSAGQSDLPVATTDPEAWPPPTSGARAACPTCET